MVAVIVEAHARGRLLGGAYRNEQFELQGLLDLAHRHQLAAAAEERIARGIDAPRQAQLLGKTRRPRHPGAAEFIDLFGRADADILSHAKRLQAVEILRRLAAEAIAGDVEDEPPRRPVAAARG